MIARRPTLPALLGAALLHLGCEANSPCLKAGGECVALTASSCLGGVPSSLSCEVDSSSELCCLPRTEATEASLSVCR